VTGCATQWPSWIVGKRKPPYFKLFLLTRFSKSNNVCTNFTRGVEKMLA